jgi:hypothetical protein
MKISKVLSILVAGAATSVAWGQAATESSWIGVWNARLEGLPGVILTLADDHGRLGGTIVFNGIDGESSPPRIGATNTLMLSGAQLKGDTLLFQVTRWDGKQMQSSVKRIDDKQAEMRCLNCDGSPVTALEKFVP